MSDALIAGLASLALLAAVFVPLERLFAAREGQGTLRPAWRLDLAFFFGQYLVWNGVAILVLWAIVDVAASWGIADLHRAVATLPLAVTVVAAVILGDVFVYWFHRACHRFEILWRFHAVHHSAEQVDWLAAHREHPVDGVLTQVCQNLPAILLGVPIYVLAPIALFRGIWAIFVHSNVRLPLGPFRWILGAPELHHWHHARVRETRHNFANLAPWLDWLFGTHHLPSRSDYPLGIEGAAPQGYFAHLVSPFVSANPATRGRKPETLAEMKTPAPPSGKRALRQPDYATTD